MSSLTTGYTVYYFKIGAAFLISMWSYMLSLVLDAVNIKRLWTVPALDSEEVLTGYYYSHSEIFYLDSALQIIIMYMEIVHSITIQFCIHFCFSSDLCPSPLEEVATAMVRKKCRVNLSSFLNSLCDYRLLFIFLIWVNFYVLRGKLGCKGP